MEPLNAGGYQLTTVSFKKELRFKMSDTSGPQRIEVLESNVGEMKVEFSHTRAQIEQMMGMMQQLLQFKSADGGRRERSQATPAGEM